MLSIYPRRYRISLRIALVAAWLFAAIGGFGMIVLSPLTIVSELGGIAIYAAGAIGLAFSLIATWGVAVDRYRFEWAPAWMAASGFSVYGATLWWLVFSGEWTRLTQASVVTAAILFMMSRALFCAAHAARLRSLHSGDTGNLDVLR